MFKDRAGRYPEDAKMTQVKVASALGDSAVGVVIVNDASEEATILLLPSDPARKLTLERVLVHRKPVFEKKDRKFKGQADMAFDAEVAARKRVLGQEAGDKYKAKLKEIDVHTPANIFNLFRMADNKFETKASTKTALESIADGEETHAESGPAASLSASDAGSAHVDDFAPSVGASRKKVKRALGLAAARPAEGSSPLTARNIEATLAGAVEESPFCACTLSAPCRGCSW